MPNQEFSKFKEMKKGIYQINPQDLILTSLASIDSRARKIIVKRYGLDGQPAKTLESIGKLYGITRERVRQIQRQAILEIQSEKRSQYLEPIVNALGQILLEFGQIMEHENLIQEFKKRLSVDTFYDSFVEFVLDISKKFYKFKATDDLKMAWGLSKSSIDVAKKVISAFCDLLNSVGRPMPFDKAISILASSNQVKELSLQDKPEVLKSYLAISRLVQKNPFGEVGLVSWNEITPRGMRDKAYIVLRRYGKPLHFKEITDKINQANFDHKKALPQTIHNEVIKDKRFVLVGRGIYALSKWGYQPGTVAEIIEKLLRENGSMSREEIIDQVLKQRLVKRNTVVLALQSKDKFKRKGKLYELVERKY